MSDYLWDKTGEPDAEVERLEALLSSFGHTPRPLALPAEEAAVASPRRTHGWRRLLPAWLFEPAGLAAAAALLLTFLLGAGALVRGRLFVDEGRAVSHDARRQQPQAPTPERRESPPTPAESANAGRGTGLTDAQARSGGESPLVRDVPRKRAGAESLVFAKPRPKTVANEPFESGGQAVARVGEEPRGLETLSAKGRAGVATLFDGTRLAAKEQLIYALRLTGAKLKEVQTKAHGADEQKEPRGGGVK
ncbi:MAG TPA: hypothetical protein VJ866_22405 [Pyrinomonadaceae bacterium]|nr:hypothetical protein [Pyrinomonadaceae bacterium]